ncbi:MAG: cytochrome c [Bryobacterales bacterium]|nr:cytochrome c [Bryobacterales bacterium]
MLKKFLLLTFLALLLAIGGALGYLSLRQPAVQPPRQGSVPMTEDRVARGKYLFENLYHCSSCHSERDFSRFGGPTVESGRGAGWVMPPELGLPGRIVASNLTPDPETGLGSWTDGEKIRAIRDGISRDGRVLFPMMPYEFYREMADEEAEAIVAYLNSLPPVRRRHPATKIAFVPALLIKSVPRPAGTVAMPDTGDRVRYGEYLAKMSGCIECHTPFVRGELLLEQKLAGGRRFDLPAGSVVSANITPDPSTGIGGWTEEQFIEKFYQYRDYVENGPPAVDAQGFTIMPWLNLSQASREELGAMYAYLMTQPAIRNPVETHPAQ